jgi:hypothetical protein
MGTTHQPRRERGNPLNRRRLPPISATTAFGGASPRWA